MEQTLQNVFIPEGMSVIERKVLFVFRKVLFVLGRCYLFLGRCYLCLGKCYLCLGRCYLCLQSLIIEETKRNTQPIFNWYKMKAALTGNCKGGSWQSRIH